ncbi:hypothetical protein SPI_09153 [Niveomyces insectorum RCEF 264]|uniref:Ribosome biogenesis protein SLX9 n=1 Tax=Niveomyces insectorum RCEF 264 TaxID=1081102 RepID=A0A167M5B5_9HYPO|nr:hypothetical protein SPI_09153 [Niveomyces insectorum RCEF 264]
MAPVAPAPKLSHHAKALARLADPTLPRKVHRNDNAVTDAFLHSKRDKLLIRKSAFRARVADKRADLLAARGSGTAPQKRRRPSKKLVATLQSLADALPVVGIENANGNEDETVSTSQRPARHSLRSRPGALRRKEMVVRAEMARFGANLAQLTATAATEASAAPAFSSENSSMEVEEPAPTAATALASVTNTPSAAPEIPTTEASSVSSATVPARTPTANRFALLRNYITATIDQSPAFKATT